MLCIYVVREKILTATESDKSRNKVLLKFHPPNPLPNGFATINCRFIFYFKSAVKVFTFTTQTFYRKKETRETKLRNCIKKQNLRSFYFSY